VFKLVPSFRQFGNKIYTGNHQGDLFVTVAVPTSEHTITWTIGNVELNDTIVLLGMLVRASEPCWSHSIGMVVRGCFMLLVS